MKINLKLLPIKAHYFCFLGCMSPIFPFLLVVAMQLGIPVSTIGTLMAMSMLSVVLMKPVIAAIADIFPSYRRSIFIMTLVLMVLSFSSMNFVSPVQGFPRVQGQLGILQGIADPPTTPPVSMVVEKQEDKDRDVPNLMLAARDDGDECYVAVAWDCVARCGESWSCFNASSASISSSSSSSMSVTVTLVSQHPGLQFSRKWEEASPLFNLSVPDGRQESPSRVYRLEGMGLSEDMFPGNLSLECGSGRWEGAGCPGVWEHWQFWIFTLLLFTGMIAFNTGVSVTDAVIVDTIGKDGDYGIQRAWGAVGWGLMGPVSGLLVDWQSGSSVTKDYMPAFLICFILGSCDILISATTIKVPKMTTEDSVLKKIWPILRHPRFFIFCIFVVFNGAFDGVVSSYLFTKSSIYWLLSVTHKRCFV